MPVKSSSLLLALALAGCDTAAPSLDDAVAYGTASVVTDVDVVDLGGASGGSASIAVSAAASGAGGRLTSWKVDPAMPPLALTDSPLISGSDHQLHVLTPRLSPKLQRELLVSASIVAGTLVIKTWRVDGAGVFTLLDTETFNTVPVFHYTLGHHQLSTISTSRKFQLVVPIKRNVNTVRLATYEVDGPSGAITARGDSGDLLGSAANDPQLSISYVSGNARVSAHYAVSYVSLVGEITNSSWIIDDLGVPTLAGAYSSGKDIKNSGSVSRMATTLASAPLAKSGYVTVGDIPLTVGSIAAELQVWESWRCTGPSCIVPLNIADSSLDVTPAVPGVQQVGAIPVLAPRGASRDPLHAMDLADKNGDVQQGIASVRKLMILMVLLDQVKAGVVDLDDMVSISEAATKPGGLGLVEDEQMSLRDLAYAMIMRSAKDATWAISEYIGGTVDNFVTMMNAKAAELGMSNTIYCHDSDDRTFSSVGYSTARDQAKLWDAVYDDPDFLDITGKLSTTVCGTLPDASQKCDLLKTRTDMFLGTDGWKGGSGAITCKGYEAVPKCNVCLSAQATRLDRPVSAVSLSSDDQPSTAFGDVWATFGWSYRQIYTPDYRGNSGAQAGVATDFGVDAVTDTFAVTVVPDSGTQLKLCHWQVVAGIGTVNKLMCATRGIAGLVASGTVATPRRVGLASLSTLEAEADYLLGRLTAGALSLSVWRVGQKDF